MLKSNLYAAFVRPNSAPDNGLNDQMLIETTDLAKFNAAKDWAAKNGYTITREYMPGEISTPDFKSTISK